MDAQNQIGRRVRLAREAKGWSQEDLAREIGVSVRTITNLENDRHSTGGRRRLTLEQAAAALDLTFEVAS